MLSFNRWAEFHPLETFGVLPGRTIYVVQDYVAANIFLPLVARDALRRAAGDCIDHGHFHARLKTAAPESRTATRAPRCALTSMNPAGFNSKTSPGYD